MFKNNNKGGDDNKDLHLADNDYRHLNLPKHDNISIKDVIAQLQESSLQPATEDHASEYPFHINLAQADTVQGAPVESPDAAGEIKSVTEEVQVGAMTEEDEIVAQDDEPAPEDPGVMLLPSLTEEAVRIQVTKQIKVPDDDGSEDLVRLHHMNKGGVQDQPRDLGIPPVDYPLQKVEPTVLPKQTETVEPVCCSYQVEIKLDVKLLYLGEYHCGCGCSDNYGYGDTQRGTGGYAAEYSSGYSSDGKGDWGGNSCCKPYEVPPEPVPNYSIVFHNCNGEQWLDVTICNDSKGTPAIASFANSSDCGCGSQYQSSYDDCCTTYKIEIPAQLGLDCDCQLTLQTDQVHISNLWDLFYSENTHFIDCHGVCYELTLEKGNEVGSGTFITQQIDGYGDCQPTFALEPCVCEFERINISLVNGVCESSDYTSGSNYFGDGYTFSFDFNSGFDVDENGTLDTFLNFIMNSVTEGSSHVQIILPDNLGVNCACPIEELVFDQKDFLDYLQVVTNYGSTAVTAQEVLNFFSHNGMFENCKDQCFELNETNLPPLLPPEDPNIPNYQLASCDDCTKDPINITFSCDLVDRFDNWVADVAPGSFDPFQFFTENVNFTHVNCEGANFVELHFPYITDSVGCGYYATEDQTIRIDIPDDLNICFDSFLQAVFDPKEVYKEYHDSCYSAGYDISNVVYEALNNGELYFKNYKTGAEYEVNWNSCTNSYVLEPASCSEDICINLVNSPCQQDEMLISANFQGGDCCGSECQTTYSYSTDCANVLLELIFYSGVPYGDPYVEFYYNIDNFYTQDYENSVTIDGTSLAAALGCTNPIENFVFNESDFISYLKSICDNFNSGSSSGITGQQVLDFFAHNGMFEDCNGNCYEINTQFNGSAPVSYVLAECDDCTHTPIAVSIDDCCVQADPGLVDVKADASPSGDSDADKLAYFSNLYNMDYVSCNGASFVEFTYFCNNTCEEVCKYNSFPPCEQTIRITVPEEVYGHGCQNGSGTVTYNISEILPNNDDLGSLINGLVIKDCNFINNFFDEHFSDYCGNISYQIPCSWGTDFLAYLEDTHSKFTTDNGICYELVQDDCGNYELQLGFDPVVLHDTGAVSSSVYEATFLLVDCKDCCDSSGSPMITDDSSHQPFLLGLNYNGDGIEGNEQFVGQHIALPDQYDCDCVIDPCSFNLIYENYGSGISQVEGFVFDVTCGDEKFDYKYTIDDGWTVTPCCEDVPVSITLNNPVNQPFQEIFLVSPPITFTYTSQVNDNVYDGHLIQTQPKEDGNVVSSVDNQFTFNFTYTHCDVNHDGVIDNFLTFQIDTQFSYYNNSVGVILSNDPPLSEFTIAAPQNDGDCCSFTMMFDEKNFVDDLITINFATPELDGQTIFNTLLQSDAIFTDCNNNQFVIAGSPGNYSLQTYVAAPPLVLDLTGNGIHLTDAANGVQYDMNHDGVKDQSAWIGSGNGLLVYDADQNHTVTNASEFILTDQVAGAKTDMEALRLGFDSNHDNVFDQKDAAWNMFGIWQDANKDAVVDNGEYHTLAQLGIASIDLASNDTKSVESGNLIQGMSTFTWADGSKGAVADVALHYEDIVQVHNDTAVTDPSVTNPTVDQAHTVAQNDPVVQSTIEQLAHQAAVVTA